MKEIALSRHTAPGRLGFTHALEFTLYSRGYHKKWLALEQLEKSLNNSMGRCYQKHWQRRQLNRRWYSQSLDWGRTRRYCFRNSRDRLIAVMLYNA